MNEIIFSNKKMPVSSGWGLLAASEPFYHADRTVDFNVMLYVFEGTIFVTEDGLDYAVNEGELLFLKKGVRHFGKREIPKGTRWFFVHFYFDEEPAEDFFSSDRQLPAYSPACFSAVLPKYLTGLRGSPTEEKILELWQKCSSEDSFKAWYANLWLSELLSFIALKGRDEPPQRLSDRIEEFLRKHLSEPFSAAAAEREFYLSYKRLAAVFKAEKGVSMQQCHDRLKMEEACRLLRSTLMPVSEAAAAVGFADPLYFSRRFRQIVGKSPTEFRRSAAEMF